MWVSLDGSGFVMAGGPAARLLHDLSEVPAHYYHVMTSIGTAGRNITALHAQVAHLNLQVGVLTPLRA